MTVERLSQSDPRIKGALDELKKLIRQHFPQARFAVSRGEDPDGVYLDATVDIEDPDQVMDVVVNRLLEMQIEEELPVHVIPLRPVERVLADMANRGKKLTGGQPALVGTQANLPQ